MLKDVLTIAFELFNNSGSSLMISNTSLATLRQIVTLLFENKTDIARRGSGRLLSDLGVTLYNKESVWIKSISNSKMLALELLHLVLQRFHNVLKTEFSDLLSEIASGLVENFKSVTSTALVKSFGSELVAPLIQTIATLLEHCLTRVPDQSEILLSMMTKQLSLVSATSLMLRRRGSFKTETSSSTSSSSRENEVDGMSTSDSVGFIQNTATSISERLGLATGSPRRRRRPEAAENKTASDSKIVRKVHFHFRFYIFIIINAFLYA